MDGWYWCSFSPPGVRPNLTANQFSELLNAQGFSSGAKDKGPRSLKDMKKTTGIEQAIDPDRARVSERGGGGRGVLHNLVKQ